TCSRLSQPPVPWSRRSCWSRLRRSPAISRPTRSSWRPLHDDRRARTPASRPEPAAHRPRPRSCTPGSPRRFRRGDPGALRRDRAAAGRARRPRNGRLTERSKTGAAAPSYSGQNTHETKERRTMWTRLARRVVPLAVLAAVGAGVAVAATGAHSGTVNSTNNAKYGALVVNAGGRTLYHMTSEKNGHIVCTGACAKFWPPLTIAKGAKPTAGA